MTRAVLVVDDSLTVRMNLVEMLEAAGLPVVACATGAEAREALGQGRFALIILDVLLPDTDGIELLKEIRETRSTRDTAVMLLSTETEVRDRIRGLKTGADEYIGKPYEPSYVIARARELVGRGQAVAPPDAETVLVIDDSITFREALRETLEAAGYRVVAAETGEEGLRLAAHERPAALVVDGVLPGIDGATVIRRIRFDAALRRTPCLLLTASADGEAEVRALDAGADAFVRKADDVTVILAKFKAMLRSAGAQLGDQDTASVLGPKKILAVDDSETYLQSIGDALRAGSYDVVLARSGEEALELLAVQSVDCILLDLLMPGVGGLETCRRLKAVPVMRDIPVVMLTAVEDRETMIEGLGAGADDFISKSSDFSVLHARVIAQLRRKQFEDENRLIREQFLQKELEAAEAQAAIRLAHLRREVAARDQELETARAQAKLRLALDAAKMGEVIFDLAGGGMVHTPGFVALFGYPSERTLSPDDIQDRYHPDDRERIRTHQAEVMAGSNIRYEIEHRVIWPDGSMHWLSGRGELTGDRSGKKGEITAVYMDVTQRKLAEEHQKQLLDELNHRVKNTLATVQSMVFQTRRNAQTPDQFDSSFDARLRALAGVHDLLTQGSWEGTSLAAVISLTLAPHIAINDAGRKNILFGGPPVHVGPNAAITLAMAFHELATNACKYGALSNRRGRLSVRWAIDRTVVPMLVKLSWTERGGPTVEAPRRYGFGSRLIEQGLVHELGGEARLVFKPEGLWCQMRFPPSAKLGVAA
ncbi:MAG TPA: response regulator [Caulobacteraceae bacterium]|jgi:PAS domain S-box-containing protein|nr:response regulator [Caulobacteraceae bacterium]